MKTLKSSDLNVMVLNTMNNTVNLAAVRLSAPVNTAAIWSYQARPAVDSAIWGTLGAHAVRPATPDSAIWGTLPSLGAMKQSMLQQHSRTEWIS